MATANGGRAGKIVGAPRARAVARIGGGAPPAAPARKGRAVGPAKPRPPVELRGETLLPEETRRTEVEGQFVFDNDHEAAPEAEPNPPRIRSAADLLRPIDEPGELDDGGGDDHGVAFVRMLNLSGQVRGIPLSQVPDRYSDGYHFIEGEPTLPRFRGDPDTPDRAARPHPRLGCPACPLPVDAMRVWYHLMREDARAFPGRKELLYTYPDSLKRAIKQAEDARARVS